MVNEADLIKRDLKHIWHPCSQMKKFETCPPIIVNRAEGSYLYTNRGPIIDAISSWWCKSLGHGHPAVIGAIKKQLSTFEHVIGANTTHPNLVKLGEALAQISGLQHVFFASDGSSAVEIAMKLAIQANQLKGYPHRKQFISLKNSYHGETLATLSVSDVGAFKKPFESLGPKCHFIQDIPYVDSISDPLWENCDSKWAAIETELNAIKNNVCAILFEPIVQGAGGLRSYSADFLHKLASWAKKNGIYLIADEIMTGFCRTGKWLASEHADIQPDMICLSKGITSGTIPFSCVLIDKPIFNLFYDEVSSEKSFLHSHTYSGNPLAVSAALATINVMRSENINQQANELGKLMLTHMQTIATQTGKLKNVRSIGAWVAADLHLSGNKKIGYRVSEEALSRGALLRPMGDTLYWLPPLTTDDLTIGKLAEITLNSIEAAYLLSE